MQHIVCVFTITQRTVGVGMPGQIDRATTLHSGIHRKMSGDQL